MLKQPAVLEVTISHHCMLQYCKRITGERPIPEAMLKTHIAVHLKKAVPMIPVSFPYSTKPDRPNELNGLRKEIMKRNGMTAWVDGIVAFVVRENRVQTCYLTKNEWWESFDSNTKLVVRETA